MSVNPAQGTEHSIETAVSRIEGLFGSEEMDGINDLAEEEREPVEDSAEEDEEVEAEESDEETTSEAEDEVEAEPEEEDEEDVEATVESLRDVAEALEMPLEDLLANLKHTVKVDGETLDVTLSELQAGYQKDADYRQKTEALKREREAFEAKAQERFNALEENHATAAYVLNTIEQQIASEFQSEDFARLRQENPTEWTARRIELQERMQHLQNLKQQAAYQYTQLKESVKYEQQQQLAATVKQESELLRQAIPNWNSETQAQVNDFLISKGWTPEQLNQVYDHRLVDMAYKTMLYERGQAKSQETVKKVKKAPKLVKPGKPKAESQVKTNSVRKLQGRLKQTGKLQDAAKLIERMI